MKQVRRSQAARSKKRKHWSLDFIPVISGFSESSSSSHGSVNINDFRAAANSQRKSFSCLRHPNSRLVVSESSSSLGNVDPAELQAELNAHGNRFLAYNTQIHA